MIRRLTRRFLPLPTGSWEEDSPKLMDALGAQFSDVLDQLNSQVQGVGDDLSVSAFNMTLKPTHAIHRVGGVLSVQYIQPPRVQAGVEADFVTPRFVSSFTGPLFLLPTEAWTTVDTGTGAGRIAANTTAVVGKVMILVYDGSDWYPSY